MYLMINGNRHTVSRRVADPKEIRYLTVTPEPEQVTGKIQMYDNNGFMISEDDADKFLRSTYSGTLLILTLIRPKAKIKTKPAGEVESKIRGEFAKDAFA